MPCFQIWQPDIKFQLKYINVIKKYETTIYVYEHLSEISD